mmetsp:Transcript_19275/g.56087  ORF Transcript_19275/g.56087 Transcript_19275/m.56087 type:complete len:123 (-) Transcript_19275:30-398(-)
MWYPAFPGAGFPFSASESGRSDNATNTSASQTRLLAKESMHVRSQGTPRGEHVIFSSRTKESAAAAVARGWAPWRCHAFSGDAQSERRYLRSVGSPSHQGQAQQRFATRHTSETETTKKKAR